MYILVMTPFFRTCRTCVEGTAVYRNNLINGIRKPDFCIPRLKKPHIENIVCNPMMLSCTYVRRIKNGVYAKRNGTAKNPFEMLVVFERDRRFDQLADCLVELFNVTKRDLMSEYQRHVF